MSKKKLSRKRSARGGLRSLSARTTGALILIGCVAFGVTASMWVSSRKLVEPAPAAQQGSLSLAKEYIYAGGRLVATEEPPAVVAPPPTAMVASAASASPTSVNLTWQAPSASGVTSYMVERRSGAGGSFVQIAANLAQPNHTDTSAASGTAHLYRVRAQYASGAVSDYSNSDLATTVAFSDDPLIGASNSGGSPASTIRAVHLTEARQAVDAVRALAGLGGATWKSDPAPQVNGKILADHFIELRTHLNPALQSLGLPTVANDTSLAVNQPVRAIHLQAVRDAVK